jgi:hypothetical protein
VRLVLQHYLGLGLEVRALLPSVWMNVQASTVCATRLTLALALALALP